MSPVTSQRAKCAASQNATPQLGLFEYIAPAEASPVQPARAPPASAIAPVGPGVIRLNIQSPKRRARPAMEKSSASRLITPAEMPDYPPSEIAAVERSIAAIPTDRALLGYKEVQSYFGVSKATANRRMKEGVVPGVRMANGVVIRDGGVRRLSREQVKWLLLAVRFARPG